MTETDMRALHKTCADAFSSNVVVSSNAIREWTEKCAQVPLQALPFIKEKLTDLDALPRNFGKAVLECFYQWRHYNPQPAEERSCCPDCDRETPGFFKGWKVHNAVLVRDCLFVCRCNSDPQWQRVRRHDKEDLVLQGWQVISGDNKMSQASFEKTLRATLRSLRTS